MVVDNLQSLIDEVLLLAKDKEKYIEKIVQPYPLMEELRKELSDYADVSIHDGLKVKVYIDHSEFKSGDLEIYYQTSLSFSKFVNAVRLTFYCSVKNPDPRTHSGYIDRESYDDCFIQEQFDLCEKLVSFFDKHGITLIMDQEYEYVVAGLDFVNQRFSFRQAQPTAGLLFFEDFFGYAEERWG
ncbi:hypothetical protein [Saprospira grandis]|uniref:hypothetical protein n=1 Tax=Saprospira grandis TaxID=1008 RepID=UPI0022DE5FE7|nr:hypothetical protein [Saprospira grandis]WBM74369.1 hypothetical protein OP864_15395 [Saprospira grandis]